MNNILLITAMIITVMGFNGCVSSHTHDLKKTKRQHNLLFNALKNRNYEKIKELTRNSVDINRKYRRGLTPLIFAAGWNNLKTVDFLIKNDANIYDKTHYGVGVIHRAAMNKDSKVLSYLLKNYQLNVNDRGKNNCSPLASALNNNVSQKANILDNVKLLLKNGARRSINWKCRGYTPLMLAVRNADVVRLLLKYGANKNIENASGHTAYDMARNRKVSVGILKLLKTAKAIKKEKKITKIKHLFWELKSYDNRREKYSMVKAIAYCKNLQLDNKENWRIPTSDEYKMVLSKKPYKGFDIDGISSYYMNPKVFSHMAVSSYWTRLIDKSMAYQSIYDGQLKIHNVFFVIHKHHVRCVHD